MRIYEEYLNRHNIKNVPIVHHSRSSSLICRLDSNHPRWKGHKWLLTSILWDHNNHHPGNYRFEMHFPVHDGCSKNCFFTQYNPSVIRSEKPSIIKKWDEYEDYILDEFCMMEGLKPVKEKDAFLTAWEIFVYIYDSWFYQQSHDIKSILYESLDKEKSSKHRYKYYQEIVAFLTNNHSIVLRSWRFDLLIRVQNYADWLATVMEQKNQKSSLILPSE